MKTNTIRRLKEAVTKGYVLILTARTEEQRQVAAFLTHSLTDCLTEQELAQAWAQAQWRVKRSRDQSDHSNN